jgi:hypothetical protein
MARKHHFSARPLVKPPRHGLAHPPDRRDLGAPAPTSRRARRSRPDRLHLLDVHRAGLRVRPIRMVERARRARSAPIERRGTAGELRSRLISRRRGGAAPPPPRQSKKKRSISTVFFRQRRLDRDEQRIAVLLLAAGADAEPPEDRAAQRRWNRSGKALERLGQRLGLGDRAQRAAGELQHVPVDRLRLPAEGVEAGMVEIGGGEAAVPIGRPAPRAVVEALAGDRDIVAVEHAVDEAGGDVGGGEPRRARRHDVASSAHCGGSSSPPAPRRNSGAGNNR